MTGHLESATAISRFIFTISRPNAFDINKDLARPLQQTLETIHGTSGRVELNGPALDASALEDMARSAAATGADAQAILTPPGQNHKVKKTLTGDAAAVSADDISTVSEKRRLLEEIRAIYSRIRGNEV